MVLNLVFDTTETRRMGIEGHVCKLQLTTRGFADCAASAQVRFCRALLKGGFLSDCSSLRVGAGELFDNQGWYSAL